MTRPTRKDPDKLREAAQMIVDGHPIKTALLYAGYAQSVARNGSRAIPDCLQRIVVELKTAELKKKGLTLAEVGKALDPQHVENAIAGRLYSNMLEGVNDGNESAKLLGTMRKHSVFEKDSMTGVIVLAAPSITPAGKPLQAIDASDVLDGELVGEEKLLPE